MWTKIFIAAVFMAAFAGAAKVRPAAPTYPCEIGIGPNLTNFALYQFETSQEAFCYEAPNLGATIVVISPLGPELRDMLIDVRILRDVEQRDLNENLVGNTEHYLSPAMYKTGTLNFNHSFKKAGKYILLVNARGADGAKAYVAWRAFSVGLFDWEPYLKSGVMSLAVIGAIAVFVMWRWRKRRAAAQ